MTFQRVHQSSSVREVPAGRLDALHQSLVLRAVAGPDLFDGSGILWMSLGLLPHAALFAEAR